MEISRQGSGVRMSGDSNPDFTTAGRESGEQDARHVNLQSLPHEIVERISLAAGPTATARLISTSKEMRECLRDAGGLLSAVAEAARREQPFVEMIETARRQEYVRVREVRAKKVILVGLFATQVPTILAFGLGALGSAWLGTELPKIGERLDALHPDREKTAPQLEYVRMLCYLVSCLVILQGGWIAKELVGSAIRLRRELESLPPKTDDVSGPPGRALLRGLIERREEWLLVKKTSSFRMFERSSGTEWPADAPF